MNKKQALQLLKKHNGNATKAAAEAKMIRSTFQRLVKSEKLEKEIIEEIPSKKALGDFRELYDKSYFIPKKIKAALAKLGSGWVYEMEFAKNAGVSLTDLHSVREQFIDYVVQIGRDGRRVWSGSKTMAEQMRKMI